MRALLVAEYFGNQIGGEGWDKQAFRHWEVAAKVVANLAVKLRLCPHSRYDARAAQRLAEPVSNAAPWDYTGEEKGKD